MSDTKAKNPWIETIQRAIDSKPMSGWSARCEKVRKLYRYESSQTAKTRHYQMLWSNMETMKPAVYSKAPVPVVSRRFKDKDPTARVAAEMLERCIHFNLDANNFTVFLEQVRDDYLLYARGQARLLYEPVMEAVADVDDGLDGADMPAGPEGEIQEEAKEAPQDVLKFERVKIQYVQRTDFVHSESRTWDEVTWVAFRSFLTREELVKRFGDEIGNKVGLDGGNGPMESELRDSSVKEDKAAVWEIWDKAKQQVCWVSPGYQDELESGEPYLKLEGFFPCPRPAYGTLTNDSLEPVPDYIFYQDQVEEIDALTARIATLQQALKLVGFYPAGPSGEGAPEVERAMTAGVENKMIAVKSWAMFKEGGSGGAPIIFLPVDQVIKVLEGCVKLRQQLIDDVYQIYGLSDIMRGDGNANETATAQNIKAQYGSVRIRQRQGEIARFCRDVCQIAGEIIMAHFQPETIMAMSNMPLVTEAQKQQDAMMAQMQAMQAQQAQAQQQAMGQPGQMGQAA